MSGEGNWWPDTRELDGLSRGPYGLLIAFGLAIIVGVVLAIVLLVSKAGANALVG